MSDPRELLKGAGQLEEREVKYPVVHLRGDFPDFTVTDEGQGDDTYRVVHLKFTDIDILELREGQKYDFPNYEIDISYSEKAESKYGRMVRSAAEVASIPAGTGFYQMFTDYLQGQRCELKLVPRPGRWFNKQTNQWEDKDIYAWEFLSVGGAASAPAETADEVVTRLLAECDTLAEFTRLLVASTAVTDMGPEFVEAAKARFQSDA